MRGTGCVPGGGDCSGAGGGVTRVAQGGGSAGGDTRPGAGDQAELIGAWERKRGIQQKDVNLLCTTELHASKGLRWLILCYVLFITTRTILS